MQNKLFRQTFLICLAAVMSSAVLFAQQRTVTGRVLDDTNAGLPGASIVVKGTTIGTASDLNGNFSFQVPSDATTLVVTFVGMDTREVPITDGPMTITLTMSAEEVDAVVVIGYGTIRRSEVTSAIASVKTEEIQDLVVTGVDQALQGKVAGLHVMNNSGQPGGGVSVRVRGITSINSNDPLIVIDGVPFTDNMVENTGYDGLGGSDGQTQNSFLATLNPNDIETIDVLKDASAQAIYGSQAANGVILITTKKGKAGDGKVTYDVSYGLQEVYRTLDVMNLREFAEYQNSVIAELGTGYNPTEEFADPSLLGEGTDWQDAIFQQGYTMDHQLGISGGRDNTSYYFSAGYFDQKGILIGSDFKRYSTRFNLDSQVKKWLRAGVSSNITRSIQNVTLADAAESTIWWSTLQNPLIPVRNLDGTWAGNYTVSGYTYTADNPVATSSSRGNKSVNSQIFGNIYADVIFFEGFSLRNEFSYQLGLQNNTAFQYEANIGTRSLQAQLYDNRSNSYYYAVRNYLNYNKTLGKHKLAFTGGHEAQYSYWESMGGKKVDLQNNILDMNAGGTDKLTWDLTGGKGDWAMESYFVRGNYTFDDRYSVSLSYRGDGSANFGPNNKWGFFPGASVGWTVTNENFASNWGNVMNYMKIRLGAGAVGNQNLPGGAPSPPYTSNVNFWPGPVGFGQVGTASTNFIAGISNADLGWESVLTYNGGIDFGFINGRIDLTVDLYKKITSNMLLFSTGPALLGIGDAWNDLKAPIGNVGQMTNTGIDVSLVTRNIVKPNFAWNTSLVFSHYKNVLDKLINESSSIDGKLYYDNYLITHTVPGYAVGTFWGLVTDGLFRTEAELASSYPQFGSAVAENETWLGDVRYKDINGDKIIDSKDLTFIGSPIPDFTFGLTNTFRYRNVDLSVFLQGSYGAEIFNFMKWQLERMNNVYYNQSTAVMDRYTATNKDGELPRFTNTNTNNTAMSDRYVEDGSYLRVQNITLGYRLPATLINRVRMNNLRLYVTVQNLYTFTNYSGYDPEVGSYNNSIRLMNVDAGHYPNPRTYMGGVSVEF
ncbi:MAG: TonB-dependent receptor [Bacteroidales bacterium]|nr:TonB-dependent receptor [Bacteroidales bacterium]NLD64300.1 TonB-dependent receptor [Bacteroidales bacterium]